MKDAVAVTIHYYVTRYVFSQQAPNCNNRVAMVEERRDTVTGGGLWLQQCLYHAE